MTNERWEKLFGREILSKIRINEMFLRYEKSYFKKRRKRIFYKKNNTLRLLGERAGILFKNYI